MNPDPIFSVSYWRLPTHSTIWRNTLSDRKEAFSKIAEKVHSMQFFSFPKDLLIIGGLHLKILFSEIEKEGICLLGSLWKLTYCLSSTFSWKSTGGEIGRHFGALLALIIPIVSALFLAYFYTVEKQEKLLKGSPSKACRDLKPLDFSLHHKLLQEIKEKELFVSRVETKLATFHGTLPSHATDTAFLPPRFDLTDPLGDLSSLDNLQLHLLKNTLLQEIAERKRSFSALGSQKIDRHGIKFQQKISFHFPFPAQSLLVSKAAYIQELEDSQHSLTSLILDLKKQRNELQKKFFCFPPKKKASLTIHPSSVLFLYDCMPFMSFALERYLRMHDPLLGSLDPVQQKEKLLILTHESLAHSQALLEKRYQERFQKNIDLSSFIHPLKHLVANHFERLSSASKHASPSEQLTHILFHIIEELQQKERGFLSCCLEQIDALERLLENIEQRAQKIISTLKEDSQDLYFEAEQYFMNSPDARTVQEIFSENRSKENLSISSLLRDIEQTRQQMKQQKRGLYPDYCCLEEIKHKIQQNARDEWKKLSEQGDSALQELADQQAETLDLIQDILSIKLQLYQEKLKVTKACLEMFTQPTEESF